MDSAKQRKEALALALAHSRQDLATSRDRVSQELNLSHQLKRSFNSHPLAWCAGSLGTATLTALLFRRPISGDKKKSGILRWAAGTAFSLAKPFLTTWAVEKASVHLLPEISRQLELHQHRTQPR